MVATLTASESATACAWAESPPQTCRGKGIRQYKSRSQPLKYMMYEQGVDWLWDELSLQRQIYTWTHSQATHRASSCLIHATCNLQRWHFLVITTRITRGLQTKLMPYPEQTPSFEFKGGARTSATAMETASDVASAASSKDSLEASLIAETLPVIHTQ